MKHRVVLGLAYNGSAYHGWQSQPSGNTVQDRLQAAVQSFTAQEQTITLYCAGRTDTGVHACEQIVHLISPVQRPQNAWVRGLNAKLPPDIRVMWAEILASDEAGDNCRFHARFSAVSRSYLYVLRNHPVHSALHFTQVGWDFHELDVAAIDRAAQYLVGTHDFSSFRSSECQAKSPIKTLHRLEVRQHGNLIFFFLKANAFLHHMVRNILGALLYVGKGKYPPEFMLELLAHRNRSMAPPTFMASGLYLLGVEYPADIPLPQKNTVPDNIDDAVKLWSGC